MEIVLNALKCSDCRNILSQPITLPCGHSICKSHTTEKPDDLVICAKCGSKHANSGFVVSQALADMITSQLTLLDFGPEHKESVKSWDECKKQLNQNDSILGDKDNFIFESVGGLKNKVLLKSEQLKLKIDVITQDLIDDLAAYEKLCMTRHKAAKSTSGGDADDDEFLAMIDEFTKRNEEAKSRLNELSLGLNDFKVDQEKWRNIKAECESKYSEMSSGLKSLQKQLLMNDEFEKKALEVEFFEKANIDLVLKVIIQCAFFNTSIIILYSMNK